MYAKMHAHYVDRAPPPLYRFMNSLQVVSHYSTNQGQKLQRFLKAKYCKHGVLNV